ncbi:amidohydrolase family protein [Sphingomonas sp.]|uniref:metal-dependent hydrolase family protein n=1 Tax=Sphingomonas sp. TaxID=28214 RepID=UPI001AFE7007|nr:amidohydrolase family protein [Sphingomonas sp.]MBO9714550.1 amidohydrolase family protein [Sphingomonas sp.]
MIRPAIFGIAIAAVLGLSPCVAKAQDQPSGDYLAELKVAAPDRWTIIHAGTLMVDPDKPLQHDVSIVVHNDRIDSVRAGKVAPGALAGVPADKAAYVELGDRFVMAGMIDAHTHLALTPSLLKAAQNARIKLLGGATTVRDAGSVPSAIFPLKELIDNGLAVGPRILASGAPLSTTGGHGDMRNGNFAATLNDPDPWGGVCDGVETCQHVARRQIALGADNIKIMATAGVLDDSDTGLDQQFTTDELTAIVKTAHLMKRKVLAHAIGRTGIAAAVTAGVDSIEHGSFIDEETVAMMKKQGTFLVPALLTPAVVLDQVRHPKPGGTRWSDNSARKIERLPDADPATQGRQVRMALRYGVKVGAGTDLLNPIGEELVMLVRKGGMSPLQALKAATTDNALLLGIEDQVGTVEAGKSADLVAFDGNPVERIEDTLRITFIMARGSQISDLGSVAYPGAN